MKIRYEEVYKKVDFSRLNEKQKIAAQRPTLFGGMLYHLKRNNGSKKKASLAVSKITGFDVTFHQAQYYWYEYMSKFLVVQQFIANNYKMPAFTFQDSITKEEKENIVTTIMKKHLSPQDTKQKLAVDSTFSVMGLMLALSPEQRDRIFNFFGYKNTETQIT